MKPCQVNEKLKVGYQGVPGSYSYEAMTGIFDSSIETVNVNEFEDVFRLVKEGKVKYGVVPIENSSTGDIHEVIDLFNKYDTYIVGEKSLKVDHCLIGIEGAVHGDIKEVYSIPQAFQQCSEYFKQHPSWKLVAYYNTAKSVELIKHQNLKHIAAVASRKAAELYGVQVIEPNINFNCSNYTRFVVIGSAIEVCEDSDKISMVLTLSHTVGSLYQVIKAITENGLNMMKIESRPIIGKPWEYYFYIDFGGNFKDDAVKKTINSLEEHCIQLKMLGNYKSDL